MRYQYTSSGFRMRFTPPSFTLPSGVKFLLIANTIIFVLTELSGQKSSIFISFGLLKSIRKESGQADQMVRFILGAHL